MMYVKKLKIIKDFHLSLDISSNTVTDTEVFVHAGDVVTPETSIAKIFRSEHHLDIDLLKELEIRSLKDPKHISAYIDVLDGQVIQKGRVLAHKSFLGTEHIIRAPFDGLVHIRMADKPHLTLQSIPVEIEVKALTHGRIISADKESIVIATNAIRVFPYFVQGRSLYGKLKTLENLDALDQSYKDTIVFYNAPISNEMVNRALAVSAYGIMGPSCTSDVLTMQDKNFSIISFEGFGSIELPIYEKIKQSDGYVVWVDANKQELIIGTKLIIEDLKEAYIKDIVFNDTVQVYDNKYYGYLGKVKEVHGDRVKVSIKDVKDIDVNVINMTGVLS